MKSKITRHHRKCKSHGGSGKPSNISHVPESKHIAWHTLFYNLKPEQIADLLSKVWIDPDYVMVAQRRTTC
jgi:hypothetical protein